MDLQWYPAISQLWNISADWVQRSPGSHVESSHALEQFKTKYSSLKCTLAMQSDKVRTKKDEGTKKCFYTKLILWQHGKTLFKLLKGYTWSNSSEVTTFPGTEPKRYRLATLTKKNTCSRSLHSSVFASALHHLHMQLPTMLEGARNCPGNTKITKFQCCKTLRQLQFRFSKQSETDGAPGLCCSGPKSTSQLLRKMHSQIIKGRIKTTPRLLLQPARGSSCQQFGDSGETLKLRNKPVSAKMHVLS